MAVSEKAINFIQGSLERGRPIPGQSLTNSPDQPYGWEQPPEVTSTREAMLMIFDSLTVPEATANILLALKGGTGVIDIASITLYAGFLEGKWNPDLMMLLMEPTMYMVMALAEKAEVEYVLESGDDSIKQLDGNTQVDRLQSSVNNLEDLRREAVNRVSPMSVPKDIREMIEETELAPSLLERVKKESNKSLLNKEA